MSDKKDIKIADAFKDGKAFIGFLTAGDPTIEKMKQQQYWLKKLREIDFLKKQVKDDEQCIGQKRLLKR